MKIWLVLFLLCSFTVLGQAQEISIEKTLGGYKFTQDSEKLVLSEIQEILQKNEEAFALVDQARSNYSIATILELVGGSLIGGTTRNSHRWGRCRLANGWIRGRTGGYSHSF